MLVPYFWKRRVILSLKECRKQMHFPTAGGVLCTGVYGDGAEGDWAGLERCGNTLKGGHGHRTEIEKAGPGEAGTEKR